GWGRPGGIRRAGPRACRDEGRKPGRRRSVGAGFPCRLSLRIAIGPEIPRTSVAALPVVPITLVAVLERPIGPRTPVGKPAALAALPLLPGDKACAVIAGLTLGLIRRPVGERLRGVRRARVRLKARLRLLINVLSLGWRSETIRQGAEIAVVLQIVALFSGRALLTALRKRLRGLRGGDEPEVMFGMLQIILRRDGISARVGVSRELEIFLGDMMRVAAYFDIRAV